MGTELSLLTKEELLKLVEIGRDLSSEIDHPTLVKAILDTACALTDSPDASIILYHEKRGDLYFAHAVGASAEFLLENRGKSAAEGIPLEGSKAGEVFRTGKSLIDHALALDTNHYKGVDRETRRTTQSMICVPLLFAGRATGVVQILNKRGGDYTERDRVLLEHFAAQAAVSLRNARLIEDLLSHMGFYTTRDDGRGPMALIDELNRPAFSERISILFADLRGFTQLSQILGRAEDTQRFLNDFLAMLSEEVLARKGIVNKFLGDGVLAFFRGDDHALNAVRCAFGMLDHFTGIREDWNAQTSVSLAFLDIGVGIATDTVILGCVGSEHAREFTAIGVGVILAAHLMENARNGKRILVDKMTFHAAATEIAEFEGPELFELKKAGEASGNAYERYHLLRPTGRVKDTGPASAGTAPARRGGVFISYSHKDLKWLESLQTHLKPYVRGANLAVWDDTKIASGSLWREEINRALAAADVAVLLVSPNFLASDFITTSELPPLLQSAKERGLTILWVPLFPSSYNKTEIGGYQAVVDPKRPIGTMKKADQDEAWIKVCEKIEVALKKKPD